MNLNLPLAVIAFGSAACCCCGGNFEEFTEGFEEGFQEGLQEATEGAAPEEGASAEAPSGGGGGGGGSMAAGTCGKFKEWSMPSPSGFSVTSCVEAGGNDSIVLTGSGTPSEACKVVSGWAKGGGWNIIAESDAMGTVGIVASKDSYNLAVACNEVMGQTMIAVSVSQ